MSEERKLSCDECKNDLNETVEVVCCYSCYERLKKDIRELRGIVKKLEEALDAKSN